MIAFFPKRYFIFASPKKYQPIIVEKAKKNRAIAIKIVPEYPNAASKAFCVNVIPVKVPSHILEVSMTSDVNVNTIKVYIKTLINDKFNC